MSGLDDGGQAFPGKHRESDGTPDGIVWLEPGMTLRDYFAAQALPALIGQYSGGKPWVSESIVDAAYQYADAMLAERAK